MSQYDSRVREHAAWKALESIAPAIIKASARADLSPEALDALDKLKALQQFIGRKLAAAEPRLVAVPSLDAIAASLVQVAHQIATFEASGDIAQLHAANSSFDMAASITPQLNAAVASDDLSGLSEAAAAYRMSVEGYVSRLASSTHANQQKADELTGALAALTQTIKTEQEKVSKLVADYQSQFSAGQTSRVEQAAKSEADRKEKFDEELKAFKTAYDEVQGTRSKTFDALINDYSAKLDAQKNEYAAQGKEALDAHKGHISELNINFNAGAKSIYDEVKVRKEEVEKLVGIIGNLGVSSGYQKTANSARTALIVWQVITVVSLVGVIAVAISSFIPQFLEGKSIPWEVLTAKLLVVVTVGILAAYAGSQADKQHQIERRNRKLALEFEALGPFLAPLSESQQEKFRLEVGDRSFGRVEDDKASDRSPVTLLDLLTELQKKDPGFAEKAREAFGTVLDRVLKR